MGTLLDDRKLLIISAMLGLAGFTGMIISSATLTPDPIKIAQIDRGMIDRKVTVEGSVVDVCESEHSGIIFLKINDGTGTITAVIFESTAETIKRNGPAPILLKGMRVQVTGRVKEYRGLLEVAVEEPSGLRPLPGYG